ncbi:MAG: hypothetical protein WCC76_17840 [Candidatus Acidiferrales bacterium]|jgi:hypothetical protein
MRLLCVISLLATIGSHNAGIKTFKNFVVFWIPPQVETYLSVTPENIEARALKIVHIKDEEQPDKIISLIKKSKQAVDTKRIRVKITADDKFYNFDSYGTGVSSAGEAVQIDFNKLKLALCE